MIPSYFGIQILDQKFNLLGTKRLKKIIKHESSNKNEAFNFQFPKVQSSSEGWIIKHSSMHFSIIHI